MAEQTSREATRIASSTYGYKARAVSQNRVEAVVITGPDTVTWAQNDTCGSRIRIPKGARPLYAHVSCAAMGTSVTLDVGFRAFDINGLGAVIDVDAVVDGLDVSAAVSVFNASGSMVAAGTDSVLSADAEAYFTLLSANPTDDADIRVTVFYLPPV